MSYPVYSHEISLFKMRCIDYIESCYQHSPSMESKRKNPKYCDFLSRKSANYNFLNNK